MKTANETAIWVIPSHPNDPPRSMRTIDASGIEHVHVDYLTCWKLENRRKAVAPMADDSNTAAKLDSLILPGNVTAIPLRSDCDSWLCISQVTLMNIRGLVGRGKSEAAEDVAAHYWRRWSEAMS